MHSTFDIESYTTSDVGLVRSNNEDYVKVLDKMHFYVLADGMGGHNAGEVASEKACQYICHLVESLPLQNLSGSDIPTLSELLLSIMNKTNLWVHHLSRQDPSLSGMGTTLCSLLFFKGHMISSHVGDSRIYRLRAGKIKRITNDHLTYKRNPSTAGESTSRKRALTQAIGTSVRVKPSLLVTEADHGDLFLMCSDGLTDLVTDQEMEKILCSKSTLKGACDFLTSLAKKRGGHDNITLLIAQLKERSTTRTKTEPAPLKLNLSNTEKKSFP